MTRDAAPHDDGRTRSGGARRKAQAAWLILGIAFATTLGVIVGQRLSSEAMAVIVGVIAGVVASIPTSLIVVFVAARAAGNRRSVETRPAPDPLERRLMIVQSPVPFPMGHATSPTLWPSPYGYAPTPGYPIYPAAPRRFTVVGGDASGYELQDDDEVTRWSQ